MGTARGVLLAFSSTNVSVAAQFGNRSASSELLAGDGMKPSILCSSTVTMSRKITSRLQPRAKDI